MVEHQLTPKQRLLPGLFLWISLFLSVPLYTSLHSVTQHSHSCHWGSSFFGHSCFPKGTRKFSVKGSVALSQIWGRFRVEDFVSVLNCWLTVEAMRRPSPGFWLWSWMKLACGKAKHCRLRCVFLTWNQLALHKYGGFLSQQRSRAGGAVRRLRRGRRLSVTSAPAQFTFRLAAGKEGVLAQILFTCAFPPFCCFMFFFLCLALKLGRGCATDQPPRQRSLCWQEPCGWRDFALFGQANHNDRHKNAFFWGGCSGTVEIKFFFCLPDWQLVLLLMMVGKDVGCYN